MRWVLCVRGGGDKGDSMFSISIARRFKYSMYSSANKPQYCKTMDPILDRESLNAPHAKGRSGG